MITLTTKEDGFSLARSGTLDHTSWPAVRAPNPFGADDVVHSVAKRSPRCIQVENLFVKEFVFQEAMPSTSMLECISRISSHNSCKQTNYAGAHPVGMVRMRGRQNICAFVYKNMAQGSHGVGRMIKVPASEFM